MKSVLEAGFIFWGLFGMFGLIVALYLVWMVWVERGGGDAPEEAGEEARGRGAREA